MPLRRKKVQRFEDTAANWTAENPILPPSWEGVESDTGKWKQGDGSTAWSALPYRGTGGGADVFTGATNGGVFFAASELPVEDDATFLYDNTNKTLKLLESAYDVATAGWSSASKAALQIGNNNTPHTFTTDPGFYGAKIDVYTNQSSGSSKQTSGIRVRASNAASGGSYVNTGVESFVTNAGASALTDSILQGVEGIAQALNAITGANAGAYGGFFQAGASSGGTPGALTNLWGISSLLTSYSAWTVTNAIGVLSRLLLSDGPTTNAYGIKITNWSGSAVVNSYGIYIDSSIDLGTTLKYALYSLSTSPSLFSGPVSGVINAYDATSWNGSAKFTTEDAVRDKIEALVALIALLDQAEVLKGTWDASAGTFPGAGAAQAGWKYIVSVGGTVDSVTFNVGDRIVAILDNASTSTYAANWFKEDYTDQVSSVNGLVGAVSLLVSEVDADNTLPGTNPLGELRTTQDGRFFHGNAANSYDQILKASNFGVRATTGTSETIASTDDKKIVTFTNASAIAASLAQAGSGSPAAFTNGWSVRLVNLGAGTVTVTPATSTIGGAATLKLGPGQGAEVNSDGTNYKCIIFDSIKIGIACSDETTAITTGTAKATFRMPCAMKLLAVRASVTTAPTGSTILIDINEGGTTVLSTKLMIDASEKTSTTAATPAVISDAVLADDAEITVDFDQVGSTIAGAGVKVWLIGIPG